jgi:hypothetical protein
MSIDLSSATAIVKFMGLGIMCFNEKMKRCETLFIHDKNHKPVIKVYLMEDLGTTNMKKTDGKNTEPKLSYFYLPTSGITNDNEKNTLTIEISGVGNCEIDGYTKYNTANFDRRSLDSDLNDYGWVVNLERDNLLGDGEKKRKKNKDKTETSKFYISNGEFFTYKLVLPDSKQKNVKDPQLFHQRKLHVIQDEKSQTETIEHSEFGYVADYVGARINADFIKIKIKVGEEEHMHLLPKRKVPYLIQVDNALSGGGSVSDMDIYQGFWGINDPKQVDLLIESELSQEHVDRHIPFKGGIPIGTRRTCYLVESDANGIKEFIEE